MTFPIIRESKPETREVKRGRGGAQSPIEWTAKEGN